MAYLTYDEYKELGGALDEAAFPMQEFRARQLIDHMTQCRVCDDAPVRESVRYAMRALIDAQAASDAHGGREVAAESNDGLSVSYALEGARGNSAQRGDYARRVSIVREYLVNETTANGTYLLQRGAGS